MSRGAALSSYCCILAGLAVLTAVPARSADAVPAWVTQAAARSVPSFPTSVGSVVLLAEEAVTVEPDGRRVMREREVVKVLQAGNTRLRAFRTYNTKSGRIRDLQGWVIPSGGQPVLLPKNKVADGALSLDYVYDEARAKMLDPGVLAVGSVFAWEAVEEEKTLFTQDTHSFQGRSPVLLSRYSLTLPAGWEIQGTVFNLPQKMDPAVTGNTYTWELTDLPRISDEDYSPPVSSQAPWLALSFFPPESNPAGLRGLKDWASVSLWLSSLVDSAAGGTDKVRAKALELTSGATTEMDKIRAIAAFVQRTNYVEVALNITRGGGYTPHTADEVLTRNYGDCKDKATLMRALLKAAGIDAYLVTVTADDPGYVRAEWASPMQFNHAIVAVRVTGAVTSPAVANTTLGRLLLFDPTDTITAVGDLPQDEQGSYALVVAGSNGVLIRMPVLATDASRIESNTVASIDVQGRLDARIARRYFGQSGVSLRRIQKFGGAPELRKRLERSFARRIPASALSKIDEEARTQENTVVVNLELTADRFAQFLQGRLLILRPGVLTSGGEYFFAAAERTAPIQLESDLRRDTIRVKLPAGFQPDELPASVNIESPYGALKSTWTVKDGEVVMEETLQIQQTLAPAREYAKVREFFEAVAGAHSAPVVLVKK